MEMMSDNNNDENMSLEDALKMIGEEYGIEGQPEIEVPDEEPDSLKPCPHCGETDTMVQSISSTFQHNAYRWLHCESCNASGSWVEADKHPGEAWNHRPVEDALRAELAQLREANRWIPVSTMPDTDGDLHFVKLENGNITTHFFNFSYGWVTDDDIAYWLPIPD